jgi:hypothetical protein
VFWRNEKECLRKKPESRSDKPVDLIRPERKSEADIDMLFKRPRKSGNCLAKRDFHAYNVDTAMP